MELRVAGVFEDFACVGDPDECVEDLRGGRGCRFVEADVYVDVVG